MKTTAIMGVGAVKRRSAVNLKVVKGHDSGIGAYIPGVWNNRFPYG